MMQEILKSTAHRRKRPTPNTDTSNSKRTKNNSAIDYRIINYNDDDGNPNCVAIAKAVFTLNKIDYNSKDWNSGPPPYMEPPPGSDNLNLKLSIAKESNVGAINMSDCATYHDNAYKTRRVLTSSFEYNFEWLCNHFKSWKDADVHIFHGLKVDDSIINKETEEAARICHQAKFYKVKMPSAYATFHGKIILFDLSFGPHYVLRLIITSANLDPLDWNSFNNSIFLIDLPTYIYRNGKKENMVQTDQKAIEHGEQWRQSIEEYFTRAVDFTDVNEASKLKGTIHDWLSEFDFSLIPKNIFPITSIPTSQGYKSPIKLGVQAVSSLMKSELTNWESNGAKLIGQSSSLGIWQPGNLVKFTNSFGVLRDHMFIVPSMTEVLYSHIGLDSTSRLPIRKKNLDLLPKISYWSPNREYIFDKIDNGKGAFDSICTDSEARYDWAKFSCRNKAMPHLKSFIVYSAQNKPHLYVTGSHNMSISAWGTIQKNGQIRVSNFEFSVCVIGKEPLTLCQCGSQPVIDDTITHIPIPYIPIYMDRPKDIPFSIESLEDAASLIHSLDL